MAQHPEQNTSPKSKRSNSLLKFQNVVNHISMIQSSLSKIKHKQQQRELFRILLLKEFVNIENQEDCEFVIHILGKDARSQDHIDYLKKAFQHLRFFSEKSQMLNEKLYNLLFKTVKHYFVKKQQIVFNYGQVGETFYIILKGQAALLIPKNPEEANEEKFEQEFFDGLDQYNLKYDLKFKSNQKRLESDDGTSSLASSVIPRQPNSKRFSMNSDELIPKSQVSLKHVMKAQAFSKFFNAQFDAQQMNQPQNQQMVFVNAYQSRLEDFAFHNYDPQLIDFFSLCYPSFRIGKIFVIGDSFGEIALITKQARTATVVCLNDTQFMTLSKQSFEVIIDRYRMQTYKEKFQLLRDFPLFSTLPQQQLHLIIDCMAIQKPRMFEIIYKENQLADFLYIIKEGEVEIDCFQETSESSSPQRQPMSRKLKTLNRISVALLLSGFIFGHEDIIQQQSRKQRAVAKSSQCELYLLPAKIVTTIANKYGNVQETLLLNHLLNVINQRNIRNAEMIKHKQSDSQEDLTAMLSTNLPLDTSQEIPQTKRFPFSVKLSHSPTNTQSPQQTINQVFESGSRMETATKSKHLIKVKKQVQRRNKFNFLKEKDFEPFFSPEYLKQMLLEKNRNLSIPVRVIGGSRQHQEIKSQTSQAGSIKQNPTLDDGIINSRDIKFISCDSDSDFSRGQKLLNSVFRSQSRQQLSKILSNPQDRINTPLISYKESSKVSKTIFNLLEDKKMNDGTFFVGKDLSPKRSNNIHSHLFCPKITKQQYILRRKLSLNQLVKHK